MGVSAHTGLSIHAPSLFFPKAQPDVNEEGSFQKHMGQDEHQRRAIPKPGKGSGYDPILSQSLH